MRLEELDRIPERDGRVSSVEVEARRVAVHQESQISLCFIYLEVQSRMTAV